MEEPTEKGGQVLPYTLCAFTGAGVMFNLILLVWHCIKFKPQKSNKYIKYGLAFLYFAYICVGISVSLLILYKDLGSQWLCKFGGFMVLFASQECLWMLAACCVLSLLWQRTQFPWKPQAYGVKEHHKWGLPIFVLAMVLKLVILAIVSFLPFLNVPFFDSSTDFYFLCTPLRVPQEKGWVYSTVLMSLNWVALLIALFAITSSIYLSKKHARNIGLTADPAHRKPWTLDMVFCSRGVKQYTLRLHAVLSFNILCWLIILLVASIAFFSGGSAIREDHVRWTLGFGMSCTVMLHPIVFVIFLLISERKGLFPKPLSPCQRGDDHKTDNWHTECPRNLLALSKLDDSTGQEDEITRYLVKWQDRSGIFVTGVMKVFHPSCQQKWRNEVNALSKLAPLDHPNICQYLWDTPRNSFTSAICTFTGDIVSQEGSVTCRLHYPAGKLQEFLSSRIQQLTEVGLHKITLDVANGLEYLHQHHLVHNGLTTRTIYMASISEKIGMKAVIGDFEYSYEVSENTLRKSPLSMIKEDKDITNTGHLFSISNALDMDNNKFAPDIRSFGLVVLEMLVSMSEFNQKRNGSKSLVAKTLAEIQGELNVDLTSALHRPSVGCGDGDCNCSSRVTDIRVCKDRPEQKINLHPDFDAIHRHAFSRPHSAATSPSVDRDSVWFTPAQLRQMEMEDEVVRHDDMGLRHLPPVPRIQRTNVSESPQYPRSLAEFDTGRADDARSEVRRSRGRAKRPVHSLPFQRPAADSSESDTELVNLESTSPTRPSSHASHRGRERHPSGRSDITNSTNTTPATVRSFKVMDSPRVTASPQRNLDDNVPNTRPSSLTTRNVRKLTEQHSLEEVSPSTPSDDIYNTSLGSLGSFDTIYEDEEATKETKKCRGETHKGKTKSSKRGQRVPHLGKRRYEEGGHKRLSTASIDESLISADSGVGSSHYDMYGNPGGSYMPGSRDTIYAESSSISDADSYSLLRNFAGKHGSRKVGPGDSGIESSVESCDELARYEKPPVVPGRQMMKKSASAGDEPEVFPDLRVRKRPCTRDHMHPPGVSCSSHPQPSPRRPPPPPQADSTSSASPNSTPDEDSSPGEPGFDRVTATHSSRVGSMPKSKSSCLHHQQSGCHFCSASADEYTAHTPDIIHPAIRSQYRHAMPKLGVSAVTSSRRMSDVSSTSSSNGTLNSIRKGSTNSAPTSPTSGIKTIDFDPSSQESLARGADNLNCMIASNSSLASSIKTVPNYGENVYANTENKNGNNSNEDSSEKQSVSDSLRSLIEDSKALLASLEESTKDSEVVMKPATNHHQHSRYSHPAAQSPRGGAGFTPEPVGDRNLLTPSSDISALSSGSRPGMGQKQLDYFQQVTTAHPSLSPGVMMDSNQKKLRQMLELVKKSGRLGFVAQQLLPLLSDCWLEDPAPSAEEILRRLEVALPTASV